MTNKSWTRLRGVVQPVLGNEPLIIELCKAFIANFRMILNVAMVCGAVLLAQQLRDLADEVPVAETTPMHEPAPQPAMPETTPLNTDRIMHWQNCTRPDYRNEHFDDCELEASEIYGPDMADPDNTGLLFEESAVLLASLSPRSR